MTQPTPQADDEAAGELPAQRKPRGRFQFSLRALCVLIVVLAVLLALAGLIESLPQPWGMVVLVLYGIVVTFIWTCWIVVTITTAFAWLLSSKHEKPSLWPWLQLTAIALFMLTPVFLAVAEHHWERQLPNGYQVVSTSKSFHPGIENGQGVEVIPGTVVRWEVHGNMVTGERENGSYFAIDTATGESCISQDAEEIRRFMEEAND